MRAWGWAIAAAALLGAASAHAQQAPRSVRIDYFQGPVIAPARVLGLAGAYVGLAEGAEGQIMNPAAVAVRLPHTREDWFDWDFSFAQLSVGLADTKEIDLSGRRGAYRAAALGTLGLNLKFGRHGFGLHGYFQEFTVRPSRADGMEMPAKPPTDALYEQFLAAFTYGYAALDGQLVLGGELVVANTEIARSGGESTGVGRTGAGLKLGALWMPHGERWRLGGTYRTPIEARDLEGKLEETEFGDLVPDALIVPWEVAVGGSYSFGPRATNVQPSFGDGSKEEDAEEPWPPVYVPRSYLLVTFDLLLTGPVRDGLGVQAFLEGLAQPSGRDPSFGARAGLESEVLENRIVLRGGSYLEPSRFAGRDPRVHLTAGADLRIEAWITSLKLCAVADVAEAYTNLGVGLGLWH